MFYQEMMNQYLALVSVLDNLDNYPADSNEARILFYEPMSRAAERTPFSRQSRARKIGVIDNSIRRGKCLLTFLRIIIEKSKIDDIVTEIFDCLYENKEDVGEFTMDELIETLENRESFDYDVDDVENADTSVHISSIDVWNYTRIKAAFKKLQKLAAGGVKLRIK
jgi:hypothetical protein